MAQTILSDLRAGIMDELVSDILPFWESRMQDPSGGFYGRIDGRGNLVDGSPKGGILNARILWTFASAYRVLGDSACLSMAERARDEIMFRFYDNTYGGTYWSLDADGRPSDTKKQIYSIAFAIYALSEMYRATADRRSLDLAKSLYHSIEEHSHDTVRGGYLEAFTREWGTLSDMRLSEKDQNDAKTMNTHLHVLEGYTGLYRVWQDPGLACNLRQLVELFLDVILCKDGHLGLFFDEGWRPTSTGVSYGHDIEASWLLCEAAEVLGDSELISRVRDRSTQIASAASEGWSASGGMIYEYDHVAGRKDYDRHWWVQAEAVVGFFNQWQITGDPHFLEMAAETWLFIRTHLIAPDGEWYWSFTGGEKEGPNLDDDRAGFWKCPYHNGRMCMEILARTTAP